MTRSTDRSASRLRALLPVVTVLVAAAMPATHRPCGAVPEPVHGIVKMGRWNYTALSDGGFAAFAGREALLVESRWDGPQFISVNRGALGLPRPLARPPGSWRAYSPTAAISHGRRLFAAELRGRGPENWRVCVWPIGTKRRLPVVMAGLALPPSQGCLAFSPDGRLIAAFGWRAHPWRKAIVICNSATGAVTRYLGLPPRTGSLSDATAVRFVSASRLVCVLNSTKVASLDCLNVKTRRLIYVKRFPQLLTVQAIGACVSRQLVLLSGRTAGSAGLPTVLVLDAKTGRLIQSIPLSGGQVRDKRRTLSRYVSDICVSRRGRFAVCTEFGFPAGNGRGFTARSRFIIIDLRRLAAAYYSPVFPGEVIWHADISPGGGRLLLACDTHVYAARTPVRLSGRAWRRDRLRPVRQVGWARYSNRTCG